MEMWERDSFRMYEDSKKQNKDKSIYFLLQRLCGVALIGATIACINLIQDGTIGIIAVPLGLYLLFTKNEILCLDDLRREDE